MYDIPKLLVWSAAILFSILVILVLVWIVVNLIAPLVIFALIVAVVYLLWKNDQGFYDRKDDDLPPWQ